MKKFTLFARIWPFTCMDSFVDIKIAFALERLGALITKVDHNEQVGGS